MASNEFLPFATATGANVQSQAAYASAPSTEDGFSSGVAPSANVNKVWRQSSTIAAAIGTLIERRGGDALDNGNVSALTDALEAAINATVSSVPSGVVVPFAGSTAPTGWILCFGQAVSRTTYATLFAAIGTTYGAGNGSTTFNLPDARGRGVFGKDDMGGSAANRITSGVSGIAGATLGATGGDQRSQQHTHTATVTDPGHAHGVVTAGGASYATGISGNSTGGPGGSTPNTNSATTGISVTNANAGAGSSENMPPALIMNLIIKQ